MVDPTFFLPVTDLSLYSTLPLATSMETKPQGVCSGILTQVSADHIPFVLSLGSVTHDINGIALFVFELR